MLKRSFLILLFSVSGVTAVQANGMGQGLNGNLPNVTGGNTTQSSSECGDLMARMDSAADALASAIESGFNGWTTYWTNVINHLGNQAIDEGCF